MKNSHFQKLVSIPADSVGLEGFLAVPKEAEGVVIFAHGSGSSRQSPRNNFVAQILREAGLGTLLFDLLTEKEDENYKTRFDISLLTERLKAATRWFQNQPEVGELHMGYFGSSTGAAAALQAAADLSTAIRAVVSRGGRPDMVKQHLPRVRAPTFLIVGGNDLDVLELNRQAYELLSVEKKLGVIPGAGHLFEEPGTLDLVARLAAEWFQKYLLTKHSIS